MNGIIEFVRTLGAARLAAMGAVAAALIFFFLFIIARVSAPAMAPLFTELALDDSARIVRELETQGIQFEIKNDGATIMIPKDRIARTRMRLAETGLPRGGNVGYEIFDRTDTLGTTSFVQNVNHVRALEGELARTIRSIDRIAAARVHLVIPERQLFTRDRQEPSASIVLQVRGSLEMSQVRAIRHLVASAVRGLKAERISIVDERGQLLADGSGDTTSGVSGAEERNAAYERKLKEQIDAIVTSVVGANRARVTVSAELDYTRVQQTQDSFDPESRVVRSTQTREEQSTTGSTQNNDGVTVANELPGNNQPRTQQQPQAQPRDNARKTEEVVNYEITRTTRTETLEPGRVKRISVAVLVDGNYTKGSNNELTYAPRAKEDLERIAALVRSAIGYNEKRGDMIEVVNLRFAEPAVIPQTMADSGFLSLLRFTTDDIMRSIEIGVMLILGLLVLLFVVRPLVRRVITPEAGTPGAITTTVTTTAPALAAPAPAQAQAQAQQVGAAPPLAPMAPRAPMPPSDHPAARLIESAQILGEAHQRSMQKVGELVQSNPQETVSVLRQWMNERTV